MWSAEQTGRIFKKMEYRDWCILQSCEKSLRRYDTINLSHVEKISKLHRSEVEFRIKKLYKFNFIVGNSGSYTIVSSGSDALALKEFVNKELIIGLGGSVGVGKESDVYEVVSDSLESYVVKFYRIGRISFKSLRRTREYSSSTYQRNWADTNISAAKREFKALKKLHNVGVSTPEPKSLSRHVLLMKKIRGEMLSEVVFLEDPVTVLRDILWNIHIAFTKGELVHGDLSEFNIIHNNGRIWLIDWPQSISSSHSSSENMLKRDIYNILRFFNKKFKMEIDMKSTVEYVRGDNDELSL